MRPSVRMQWNEWNGGSGPSLVERATSCLPYLMPLLDGLVYGRYLFEKFPAISGAVLPPLIPLYAIYRGVPFLPFALFLVLLMTVVRNGRFSRFVRFNTMQALALDIAIILPQLLVNTFQTLSLPLAIVETLSSATFYGVLGCVLYAFVSCVRGVLPDGIPIVSDAANSQIGGR